MNRRALISWLATTCLLGSAGELLAQTPVSTAFSYQGRLNESGSPANGSYDFQFLLFDVATGGTALGTVAIDDQAISNGLFQVELDYGSSVFDGSARWLEVQVRSGASSGAYTTVSPRQAITATPYALYALTTPWSDLTGMPPGFADGIDDDTTYTAGAGLALTGIQFSLADLGVTADKLAAAAVGPAKINPTGAVTGQALMYDGAAATWGNPTAAKLVLPFSATANTAANAPLFAIESTGSDTAGAFIVNNAINSVPALVAVNTGSVGLFAQSLGNREAGIFDIHNVANPSPAITATSDGLGGIFSGSTTGPGIVFSGSTTGAGSVFSGSTTGAGIAAKFAISNAASASAALDARTNGTGPTVEALNSGLGRAGHFQITNNLNPNSALVAESNGSNWTLYAKNTSAGSAGYFQTTLGTNANPAFQADSSGTGPALKAVAFGSGLAGQFVGNVSVGGTLSVTSNVTASGNVNVTGSTTTGNLFNTGLFRLGTAATAGQVLRTDALGYGTWGTLADSALSSNVALLNNAQTFTGAKTFSAAATFSSPLTAFSAAPSFTNATVPFAVTSSAVVTNLNAYRLEGVGSASFLRSDMSDDFTSGTLTFNAGTTLDIAGTFKAASFYDRDNIAYYLDPSSTTTPSLNIAGDISMQSLKAIRSAGHLDILTGGTGNTLTLGGTGATILLGDGTDDTVIVPQGTIQLRQSDGNSGINFYKGGAAGKQFRWDNTLNQFVLTDKLEIYSDLYIGNANGNHNIFFFDVNATNEYLRWNDLVNRFEFSDQVQVGGNLTATGNVVATGNLTVGTIGASSSINFANGTPANITWDPVPNQFTISKAVQIAGNLALPGSLLTFSLTNDAPATIQHAYDIVISKDIDNDSTDAWFRVYTNGGSREQMRIGDDIDAATLFDGAVTANGLDYAEAFKITEPDLAAGDVVSLAVGAWEFCRRSSRAYDPHLLGVVSEKPSFVCGMSFNAENMADPQIAAQRDQAQAAGDWAAAKSLTHVLAEKAEQTHRPVALAGRVPCKVTGSVRAGDFLTTSDVPGCAVAMTQAGPSIGVALEDWSGSQPGRIMVLVQPGWRDPVGAGGGGATAARRGDLENDVAPPATALDLSANERAAHPDSTSRVGSPRIDLTPLDTRLAAVERSFPALEFAAMQTQVEAQQQRIAKLEADNAVLHDRLDQLNALLATLAPTHQERPNQDPR